MSGSLTIKQGALIVFEGLDKAGKTTQVEQFQAVQWGEPKPHFVHMPSGMTNVTKQVYQILEGEKLSSPLARQLFHLACHAENVPAVSSIRKESAVILDRFWWSTIAYGWHEGRLSETALGWDAFMNVIDSVWGQLAPDLVFLFINAHEEDRNNSEAVETGYRALAHQFAETTVLVPVLSVEGTTAFITDELIRRGIAS
jgi:dTMP kinase